MLTISSCHNVDDYLLERGSGPITRSGICQRVDDLPQAGHSRRDQVHTDNDGEPVFHEKGTNRLTPEGGRGAAPRPGGWARIPIWGRGNDSRLRGLPGYPPAKPEPKATRQSALRMICVGYLRSSSSRVSVLKADCTAAVELQALPMRCIAEITTESFCLAGAPTSLGSSTRKKGARLPPNRPHKGALPLNRVLI